MPQVLIRFAVAESSCRGELLWNTSPNRNSELSHCAKLTDLRVAGYRGSTTYALLTCFAKKRSIDKTGTPMAVRAQPTPPAMHERLYGVIRALLQTNSLRTATTPHKHDDDDEDATSHDDRVFIKYDHTQTHPTLFLSSCETKAHASRDPSCP